MSAYLNNKASLFSIPSVSSTDLFDSLGFLPFFPHLDDISILIFSAIWMVEMGPFTNSILYFCLAFLPRWIVYIKFTIP